MEWLWKERGGVYGMAVEGERWSLWNGCGRREGKFEWLTSFTLFSRAAFSPGVLTSVVPWFVFLVALVEIMFTLLAPSFTESKDTIITSWSTDVHSV